MPTGEPRGETNDGRVPAIRSSAPDLAEVSYYGSSGPNYQ